MWSTRTHCSFHLLNALDIVLKTLCYIETSVSNSYETTSGGGGVFSENVDFRRFSGKFPKISRELSKIDETFLNLFVDFQRLQKILEDFSKISAFCLYYGKKLHGSLKVSVLLSLAKVIVPTRCLVLKMLFFTTHTRVILFYICLLGWRQRSMTKKGSDPNMAWAPSRLAPSPSWGCVTSHGLVNR